MRKPNTEARESDALVTINSVTGLGGPFARLRVEDARSGTVLIEIDLDPEAYFNALNGRIDSRTTGKALFYGGEAFGRWPEHMTVGFDIPRHLWGDERAEWIADTRATLVAEYEPHGWTVGSGDRTNDGKVLFRMYRYHDTKEARDLAVEAAGEGDE